MRPLQGRWDGGDNEFPGALPLAEEFDPVGVERWEVANNHLHAITKGRRFALAFWNA